MHFKVLIFFESLGRSLDDLSIIFLVFKAYQCVFLLAQGLPNAYRVSKIQLACSAPGEKENRH